MRVYRLEFRHNKHNGPFNPPPKEFFGFFVTGNLHNIAPADASQIVATVLHQKGPYAQPGIINDGVTNKQMLDFVHRVAHGVKSDVVFGFSSLAQYREWFPSKPQREALFTEVSFDPDNQREKTNDLELREFEVPDDRVMVANHQVAFRFEDAVSIRAVPRKEAIA